MKYEEINKRFTQTVAEWLVKGYAINTSTMSGSQGEIAKIDLTNGDEIIRVLAKDFHEYINEKSLRCYDGIEIIVGKVVDEGLEPHNNCRYGIVWNNRLEVISTERFYLIGENRSYKWYGTKEEADYQKEMKHYRWEAKRGCDSYRKEFSDEAKKAVIAFVKRQPKCKSVKVTDITVIRHIFEEDDWMGSTRNIYEVQAKGNWYRLK